VRFDKRPVSDVSTIPDGPVEIPDGLHRRRIAGINGVSACELELVELVLIRTRLNLEQEVTRMHLVVT
jgi:hypothetical protein